MNKLVPATALLCALYKSGVYDYDYDYEGNAIGHVSDTEPALVFDGVIQRIVMASNCKLADLTRDLTLAEILSEKAFRER